MAEGEQTAVAQGCDHDWRPLEGRMAAYYCAKCPANARKVNGQMVLYKTQINRAPPEGVTASTRSEHARFRKGRLSDTDRSLEVPRDESVIPPYRFRRIKDT